MNKSNVVENVLLSQLLKEIVLTQLQKQYQNGNMNIQYFSLYRVKAKYTDVPFVTDFIYIFYFRTSFVVTS